MWFDIRIANDEVAAQMEQVKEGLAQKRAEFDAAFELKKKKLTQGDELQAGVQKMVKVYVGCKASPAAGRQDGGTSRQQGCGIAHRAGGRHAVHGGWHTRSMWY